jgi:ABC-type Mn2+/Zn2+ transport system permease subunit
VDATGAAGRLFLAPLCALLGVFVTARRMAFFSDTISHAGLTGVALGAWLGLVDPTWPLIAVSLAVAAAIYWLKENTELVTDSIMALLLSGSVAAGLIILSLLKTRRAICTPTCLATFSRWAAPKSGRRLLCVLVASGYSGASANSVSSGPEEMAQVCGVPVRRLNYLFVIVLT